MKNITYLCIAYRMVWRSKIRKNRVFNKFKIMSKDKDIKEWRTQSVKHKVATVLIMDGTPFRYDEENGITFTASATYVEKLRRRLVTAHGCSVEPVISEA